MDYNAAANDPTVLVSLLSEIKGELSSLRNEIKEKDSKINSLEAALSKLQEEHKTDNQQHQKRAHRYQGAHDNR